MTRWKAISTTHQNVLILIREGDDIILLQLLCSSHSYLAHTEEVNTGAMEWEFVPVPIDLKAHVIGRRHSVINEMMAISGATIQPGSRHHAGFIVSGRRQEIEMAKQFISEKLVSFKFGNFKINVILFCGRWRTFRVLKDTNQSKASLNTLMFTLSVRRETCSHQILKSKWCQQ